MDNMMTDYSYMKKGGYKINKSTPSLSHPYGSSGKRLKTAYMKRGGININPANKGKFTAKANKAGMGVQSFASKVMGAPEGKYSPSTRRQANFARNASKWKKG
jgi:hypothetical protein